MPFKNEYVPPPEQETSEFLRNARETLRTGYSKYDSWTVDREEGMVLFHEGSGHELEDANHDLWRFIDREGYYLFGTDKLSSSKNSPEEIVISYKLKYFRSGERYAQPNTETLLRIKDALHEYKDWGVISDYKRCQITLIDARTGKEV